MTVDAYNPQGKTRKVPSNLSPFFLVLTLKKKKKANKLLTYFLSPNVMCFPASLHLEYLPKSHLLEVYYQVWCSWEVAETY